MDITSANAVLTISVSTLFPQPVPLQQFSAEDIYTAEAIAIAEVVMGVDGRQSGGYTPRPVPQQISLQSDSPSIDFFEQWANNTALNKTVYGAQGVLILPSLNRQWTMNNGILAMFKPMPDAAKILQPRRFTISWESVQSAPV